MRYPVPNLRRDLAVRIALLIMAFVAVVPAVLAACERYGLDRRAMLRGLVGGLETMVRLSLVAPIAPSTLVG